MAVGHRSPLGGPPKIKEFFFVSRGSTGAAFNVSLYVIVPGGRWPEGTQTRLLTLLQSKISSQTWEKLQAIKAAIEVWSTSDTLDPIEIIASILEALGDLEGTFIAEDVSSFPDGVFIPRSMTPEQFIDLANC